jgi:hypothetical protein
MCALNIKSLNINVNIIIRPNLLFELIKQVIGTETIGTLTGFSFSGLWPEIQAIRYAGGR